MLDGCVPWAENLSKRYLQEGYWTSELLGDLLEPWAQSAHPGVALVTEDEVMTYAELDDRARRLASGLHRLGIRPGDRVVVQLPNGVEIVVVSFALFRLGAIPVFALAAHRRHEITYLCRHSEAVAYFIPDAHRGFDYRELATEVLAASPSLQHVISTGGGAPFLGLEELDDRSPVELPEIDPGEVAFFLLSGGTTGDPKLIPRTHRDYAYQLRASADAVGLHRDSVYLATLPVAHNAALGCPGVLGTLRAGGKVVLTPSPSPGEAFPLIEQEGVTLTTLMPSVLKVWIEMTEYLPTDLKNVLLQVGGARLDPQVAQAVFSQLGGQLTHWFGMAEGFLCHTRLDDPESVVVASTGRPLCAADEVRVVDERDREVEPGQTGELLVRGPYTLCGYYRAEDYNRTAFTADGFLRTGDLVHITERGDMVVDGRIKEIVNRNGEKVPTGELEHLLETHPRVRQAAVFAMPDPEMVERTCACIIADGDRPTALQLREFLEEAGLAAYKLPDQVELVDSLPYTSLGKVDKRLLRERLAAGPSPGELPHARTVPEPSENVLE